MHKVALLAESGHLVATIFFANPVRFSRSLGAWGWHSRQAIHASIKQSIHSLRLERVRCVTFRRRLVFGHTPDDRRSGRSEEG